MTAVVSRGLDLSHYQGAVNWKALKSTYGLSFGAAKASEGVGYTDSEFLANWSGMRSAGLARIGYHYARPEQSTPAAQASRLVNLAKSGSGGLAPGDALCLDLEASALSQGQTNAWMRAFGAALRQLAPGVTTVVYLGGYAANGSGQDSVGSFDRWWYPHYVVGTGLAKSWPTDYAPHLAGNTTGWQAPPAPHMWQWSPNVDGRDANVSNLTIAELFTTTEDQLPYTLDQIAQAIWSAPVQANTGATARAQDWMTQANVGAKDARDAAQAALAVLQAPDALASAIVAHLPAPAAGGITVDDVRKAVRDVLVGGTAVVPA